MTMTEPRQRQQRLRTTRASSIVVASSGAPPSSSSRAATAAAAAAMPIPSINNIISRNRIQSIWKSVQQQAKQSKFQRLQERLRDKRNAVLLLNDNSEQQEQQHQDAPLPFAALLSKTMSGRRPDPITGSLKPPMTITKQSSSSSSCYTVPVVPFAAIGGVRLPTHKFCTMASTSCRVQDQEELRYVPSAIAELLLLNNDDDNDANNDNSSSTSDDDDNDNDDEKDLKKKKATTNTSNNSGSSSAPEAVAAASSGGDGGCDPSSRSSSNYNNNSPSSSSSPATSSSPPQQPPEKRTRQYFDLFQTKAREREIAAGPVHQQLVRNENIRQVMQQIQQIILLGHSPPPTATAEATAASHQQQQHSEQDPPDEAKVVVVVPDDELILIVAKALNFEPNIVREAVMGPKHKNSESASSQSSSSSSSSSQQQEEDQQKKPPPPLAPNQQKKQPPPSKQQQQQRKAPPPASSSNNSNSSTVYCGNCVVDTKSAQVQREQEAEYLKLQDSLRHLWCPRCYIYDCSIHHDNGISQPTKSSLQLSLELGWLRERQVEYEQQQQQQQQQQQHQISSTMTTTAHAAAAAAAPENETDENADVNVTATAAAASQTTTAENNNIINSSGLVENSGDIIDDEMKSSSAEMQGGLTSFHMSIAHRYYVIFQGDVEKMAIVMQAPRPALEQYIKARGFVLPKEEKNLQQPKRRGYYSTRNYNQKWVKEIANDGTSRPSFQPCVHDAQVCNPDVCSCIQQHQFCTKFCAWRNQSKNFFRGCECKSDCGPSCSCNAHGRECDPDLCRCDTCTDPPGPATKNQSCRNDNVTMRRGVPLMVGISDIPNAGFGVFSKHDLAAGTFLGEYVGEIISQDEAERRGQLYDMRNHSCLFNFSSDLVVDADARASRLRFLNHSTTPNCEPKLINVAGGTRIAFFTLKKVAAQMELTFNYGYDELSSTNCASFIHRSAAIAESAKEVWFRYTVTEDVVKKSDNATKEKKRKARPSKLSTSSNNEASTSSLTAASAKKMDSKPSPKGNRRNWAATTHQLKPPPPPPPAPPNRGTTTMHGGGLRRRSEGQARTGQVVLNNNVSGGVNNTFIIQGAHINFQPPPPPPVQQQQPHVPRRTRGAAAMMASSNNNPRPGVAGSLSPQQQRQLLQGMAMLLGSGTSNNAPNRAASREKGQN